MTAQSNLKLSGPICVWPGQVCGRIGCYQSWAPQLLSFEEQQRPAHVSAAVAVVTTTFKIALSFDILKNHWEIIDSLGEILVLLREWFWSQRFCF